MSPGSSPVRVFLVDDHEVVRRGVAEVLEEDPGITVTGEAGSVAEALVRVPAVRPDVVLVDIALGAESGFELTRRLVDRYPDLRAAVVLISTRREDEFTELIADSPAAGFLWKAHLSASAVRDLVAAGEP